MDAAFHNSLGINVHDRRQNFRDRLDCRLGGRIALSEKAARYQHHYRDKNGRDGALRRPPRPEEITLK